MVVCPDFCLTGTEQETHQYKARWRCLESEIEACMRRLNGVLEFKPNEWSDSLKKLAEDQPR